MRGLLDDQNGLARTRPIRGSSFEWRWLEVIELKTEIAFWRARLHLTLRGKSVSALGRVSFLIAEPTPAA